MKSLATAPKPPGRTPHKRTIRAPHRNLATALCTLINRGSFHGGDLPMLTTSADNVAKAERAIERVAKAGWIARGIYELSKVQLFFGLQGSNAKQLLRAEDPYRCALACHWITITTKYLEPANVAAVIYDI